MRFKKYNRKPNKIWLGKGSEFYNRSIKSWLDKKIHSKSKSFVAERFINNKIYKE